VELASSQDLLVWLVDVWESGAPRAGKLARGELLLKLAVEEGKIPDGPIGLQDDFSQWFEDLRSAGWIVFDDREAAKVRFSHDSPRTRNDVNLSRNFAPTATGATWLKSSLTAASVGQVSIDLGSLAREFERRIAASDAPEETKEEARRLVSRLGETALTSSAAELLVRVFFGLVGGPH
jgi:hypothetical protein